VFRAKVKTNAQKSHCWRFANYCYFPEKPGNLWLLIEDAQQIVFNHERVKLLGGTLPAERKVVNIKNTVVNFDYTC